MRRPEAVGLWLVVLFAVAVASWCCATGCGASAADTNARIAETTRVMLETDATVLYGAITNEAVNRFTSECDVTAPQAERLACSRAIVEQVAARYDAWADAHNAALEAYYTFVDACVAAAESQDDGAWERVRALAGALAGHIAAMRTAGRLMGHEVPDVE